MRKEEDRLDLVGSTEKKIEEEKIIKIKRKSTKLFFFDNKEMKDKNLNKKFNLKIQFA